MIKFGRYKGRQKFSCLDCKHTTSKPRQRVPKISRTDETRRESEETKLVSK